MWTHYEAYLKSPEWASLRRIALERAGHKCQVCNTPHRLEVHHRKYGPQWGQEKPENLTVLCHACHNLYSKKQHAEKRKRTSPKPKNPLRHISVKTTRQAQNILDRINAARRRGQDAGELTDRYLRMMDEDRDRKRREAEREELRRRKAIAEMAAALEAEEKNDQTEPYQLCR